MWSEHFCQRKSWITINFNRKCLVRTNAHDMLVDRVNSSWDKALMDLAISIGFKDKMAKS